MANIKDLGDGLVLRHATKRDTDALVEMQIHAFGNPDTGEPDIYLGGWTRDMMGGKHPTFRPHDFLVVQDTKSGAIVSCTCLISQTWTMDGIPFGVGRVEIVGTTESYRRRGLVREQFKVLHEMSRERGELVQGITGIPYYYRQFGYEYALDLPAPRQTYIPQQIPELKQGEQEKFRLRHARRRDLEFVSELYRQSGKRSLVHCERDLKMFEFEHFKENDRLNGHTSWWDIIETTKGERAGILYHRRYVYRGHHNSSVYEVHPSFTWQDVTPFVLRELVRQGQEMKADDKKSLTALGWFLQANHPFYELFGDQNAPYWGGYAWYIRVADLPAFLLKLTPLLERRLAASEFRCYSGTLRLNFFRSGVEIRIDKGKIKSIEPWRPTADDNGYTGYGSASFPELTFLKLVFGYRSRSELEAAYPDCLVNTDLNKALLDALFPKKASNVIPIH